MSQPPRRYSEEELRTIFRRASARQEAAQAVAGSKEGLTLAELQQVGAEAGIAPGYVAAAAGELDRHARGRGPWWSGSLGRPRAERFVPGAVSEEAWVAMVEELKHTYGRPGTTSENGPTREWTKSRASSLRVTLREEGGVAHFSASESSGPGAVAGPALAMALGGVTFLSAVLVLTFGAGTAWLLLPVLFATLALASFAGGRRAAWKQEQALDALLDRLETIALRAPEPPGPESTSADAFSEDQPAGRLSDVLGERAADEADEEASARTQRRRTHS